jgi:hypothetical protein
MKKYSIFLFLSIVVSSFLVSCNDDLNLQKDGRIDVNQIFKDRYMTMGYLNSCYGNWGGPYIDRASYCDEAQDCDYGVSGARANWYDGNLTASTYAGSSQDGSPWTNLYEGIRKCNIFLANIRTANIFATDEEKQGWTAQAYTLRALYYLQLIKRYGSVPLIVVPIAVDHDYSKDTKSSFSTVATQILADCDSALTAPNTQNGFSWNIYNNQYQIMSRAVAYAIKSETVTYAASPLWADGTYTWAQATAINKEALSQCLANDYSLFNVQPTSNAAQNPYALYFITSSNDMRSVDKETIFQGGGQMAIWQNAGMPTTDGVSKSGPCPSQELVDSYEMANGQPAITGYSDASHLQPIVNAASGYDPANPYVGRDPRFYASIYYNGGKRTLGIPNYAALKFTASSSFYGVTAQCPSWSDSTGNITFTLYKWNTDYNTTISGVPLKSTTFINYYDNSNLPLEFSTPLPAGDYLWLLSQGTQTVGVWKATNGSANAQSYYQNVPVTGYYQTYIAYSPITSPTSTFYGQVPPAPYTDFIQQHTTRTAITVNSARLVNSYVGGSDGISQDPTNNKWTRTGYYVAKFNNWQSTKSNSADGAIRIFRLGELYLNFAESAYQSDGPDVAIDCGNGLTLSARGAVNAIRTRAGMPNLPTGLSASDFETRYRNERRVELAFESQRFFDVRRWKILSSTDKVITGMQITPGSSGYTYARFKFDDRNCISDKWLLYPIDQSEVNKVQGLSGNDWQNPGW